MSAEADADSLASDPRIGQVILDRYEIVRPLAEGGMGAVYEARHREIGRRFAVKFLRAELRDDPRLLARFRQEARMAGNLESEHIAAIIDLGTGPDGAPCLVMEYLDGQSLEQLLQIEGSLPVARAAAIVRQICAGLRLAHAHDIVHRDLKPKNLIVCRGSDGRDLVKIVDFGIAKAQRRPKDGSTTTTGATLGTPHYMSPEQARGEKKLDHRTDIYSLGVVLYELLTGARAHPGDSYNAIIYHILSKAPEPIRSVRPEVPEGLARVVQRAMAIEANDRYASVDELASALAPYAPGTSGLLDSNADTLPRAAAAAAESVAHRRKPRRVGLIAAFLVGGAIATGLVVGIRTASSSRAAESAIAPAVESAPVPSAEPFVQATPSASSAPSVSSVAAASSQASNSAEPDRPLRATRPMRATPPAAGPAKPTASSPFDWKNPYE